MAAEQGQVGGPPGPRPLLTSLAAVLGAGDANVLTDDECDLLRRDAQACGAMLAAVPAGGNGRGGRICPGRPKQLEPVVVTLAVLCGRPLSDSIVRQFAVADSRGWNLKRNAKLRCTQLTQLDEAALACMTVSLPSASTSTTCADPK